MNTFIRQKQRQADRQTDKQQTMTTQSYKIEEMTKN